MISWVKRFLRRVGVCGNAGAIVGILAGGALALLDFLEAPLVLADPDALRVWAILALFGWLVLLFVFRAFVRWPLASVALPALVNAILVAGLTVYLARALDLYPLAWLLGWLLGILVGFLLCRLSRLFRKEAAR
jgi:hypothetical protein